MLSVTHDFIKAKRNRIEDEDLVEENPASLLKLDEKKTRENVGGPTTEPDSTIGTQSAHGMFIISGNTKKSLTMFFIPTN